MFAPLLTDYYQLTMSIAYLYSDTAKDLTGFESFVRTIRKDINPNKSNYIFKGENEINVFMAKVREDIKNPIFFEEFWKIVSKMIKNKDLKSVIQKRFEEMPKDFTYTVIADGTIVKPLVPVFQFFGPKMIGQLIETYITNIVNGKTGLATYEKYGIDRTIIRDLYEMVYPTSYITLDTYMIDVKNKAIELRNKTSKPIFEAGFRRAPSLFFSIAAVKVCMDAGFNGTSNIGAFYEGIVDINQLGGTMGHAFVMGFATELEAFKIWNELFPNSTILLDTYDTINAVKTLIDNNIKPSTVRIDSEPLDTYSFQVREILDQAGWNDVKIYISGDITPEMIEDFEERKVPFDMFMVGTKVVNVNLGRFINAGFVYKVVEVRKENEILYPEKKAFGKGNYPGLKFVFVENDTVKMKICDRFGFEDLDKIKENSGVEFDREIYKKERKASPFRAWFFTTEYDLIEKIRKK